MSSYCLHGLVIESELALPAMVGPSDAAVALRAVYQAIDASKLTAPSEVVAQLESEAAYYRISRGDSGLHCSYGDLGQVLFKPDGRAIVATSDTESAAALFSGSALAMWLVARGELVLHASAVAWDDLTVAIVGGSQVGKTTLAAQCVLAGARLVGDDVLRLDLTAHAAVWHSGMRWLRLREGASALLDGWAGSSYQSKRDQRWVALPPHQDDAPASGQLSALIFPALSEDRNVRVQPVGQAEALKRLLLVPRVRGLRAHALLRAQLQQTAKLVRTVRCFDVAMPLGPPFRRESAEQVRHALKSSLAATSRS